MMRRITKIAIGIAVTAMMAAAPLSAQAAGQYQSGTTGVDISWPNCSAKIASGTPFGVVGLSDGLVYSDNPCAATEAAHFGNVSLYVNTGLNASESSQYYQAAEAKCTAGDTSCAAYQYGYAAAKEAYDYAVSQGLANGVANWWLDVETDNTWDTNTALNVASLQGEHDAIVALAGTGVTVGIYSTNSQWNSVVGTNWSSSNTWPVWYATGQKSAKKAQQYCGASYGFTGGQVYLAQYVAKGLDWDYAC